MRDRLQKNKLGTGEYRRNQRMGRSHKIRKYCQISMRLSREIQESLIETNQIESFRVEKSLSQMAKLNQLVRAQNKNKAWTCSAVSLRG